MQSWIMAKIMQLGWLLKLGYFFYTCYCLVLLGGATENLWSMQCHRMHTHYFQLSYYAHQHNKIYMVWQCVCCIHKKKKTTFLKPSCDYQNTLERKLTYPCLTQLTRYARQHQQVWAQTLICFLSLTQPSLLSTDLYLNLAWAQTWLYFVKLAFSSSLGIGLI